MKELLRATRCTHLPAPSSNDHDTLAGSRLPVCDCAAIKPAVASYARQTYGASARRQRYGGTRYGRKNP